MTRAIDRLIVSGAIGEGGADAGTPIGWVLDRLDARELDDAGAEPLEIERGGARLLLRVDRFSEEPEPVAAAPAAPVEEEQLELFAVSPNGDTAVEAPVLAPLAEVPAPPLHRVRRLSYSALSLFERCSYRYFAERVVGLRPAERAGVGEGGLAATEVGDAVHMLLEAVSLGAPAVPADLDELVRARYPEATAEELERIRAFVAGYCDSELAARIASLEGAAAERPFAFEHDGVLLHGRLDVLHRDGPRALVVDYKTNSLAQTEPAEIVEHDYHLQRLVYALACFRGGAEEVEVVYQFLERPDDLVTQCYKVGEAPELERELSAAITRIQAGEFRPTPDEFVCGDCPALNLVCAGPRLRGA
jgi:RecB family exonuclease